MKYPTLVQKFNILSLIALIVFVTIFSWIITQIIEHSMISNSKHLTALYVANQVKNQFSASSFVSPITESKFEEISSKIEHLLLDQYVERIKIWNNDMVVIWADKRDLIGKKFLNNKDLREALTGKVSSKFIVPGKEEHKNEHGYQNLLELYVPIKFDPEAEVKTVFEIYQDITPLYADIFYNKKIVWITAVLSLAFLHLALFAIVRNASRHIEAQTMELALSEEKHRNLVQSAQNAIISTDRSGRIVLFNNAAELIFGYSASEVEGQFLDMLMPEPYRERHREGLRRFLETGNSFKIGSTLELEGLRKGGEVFPLEMSLSVSGESDRLLTTGIIRDVSERKQAEQELKRRVHQQEAVAELGQQALAGIAFTGLMDKAVGLVAQTLDIECCGVLELKSDGKGFLLRSGVGWKAEIMGLEGQNAMPQSRTGYAVQSHEPVISAELATDAQFSTPRLFHDHNLGSSISVAIQARSRPFGMMCAYTKNRRPFSKDDGHFLQAVANVLATTIDRARVETQRQKHERIALSRERLARIGEISAGVSHTIRNPLHGIINGTDILRKKLSPEDSAGHEICDLMLEGLHRIEMVTNRLLTLTRDAPLQTVPANIPLLVQDTLKFVEAQARKGKVSLVTEMSDVPALPLDPDRFSEALINLLDNALGACRKGDRITVKAISKDDPNGGVWITIEDTGKGIPAEHLDKVMDPFFTTKPVGEGSGLGLAIARRIVEEHGGKLILESKLQKGTKVKIFIPFGADKNSKKTLPYERTA